MCLIFIYTYQQRRLIDAHKNVLQQAINQKIDELNRFMESEKKMFEQVALAYNQEKTIQKNDTAIFHSLTLINIEGTVIASQDSTLLGKNIFKNDQTIEFVAESATRALMGLTTDISHLHPSLDQTPPTLIMSTATFLEKRLAGVVSGHYNIDRLYSELSQKKTPVQQGASFFAIMETSQGIQCVSPFPEGKLKAFDILPAGPSSVYTRAVNGERASAITRNAKGKKVIMAFQYLPLLDWSVISEISYGETFYPLLLFYILIISVTLIMIFSAIFSFFPNHAIRLINFFHKSR